MTRREYLDAIEKELGSLPDLPCRVSELTGREYEIYKTVSKLVGFLQFLSSEMSLERD